MTLLNAFANALLTGLVLFWPYVWAASAIGRWLKRHGADE